MMTEHTFYILAALSEKPRHGYELIKRVTELSDNRVRLATGSLYPALERLLGTGLIARLDHSDPAAPNRRYYKVTGDGEVQFAEEVEARERQVVVGRASLGALRARA
jgi:PadR family transcriptional regulator, regulatory protein PadR